VTAFHTNPWLGVSWCCILIRADDDAAKPGRDRSRWFAIWVASYRFVGVQWDGLEQASILMQGSAAKPTTAFVDLVYRGVQVDNPQVRIVHRDKAKRGQERMLLKRRQATELIIGPLKADHRMDRCPLKDETGDRLHAVLSVAGLNIRWRLRRMAKKGGLLTVDFLRLSWLAAMALGLPRPNRFDSHLAAE